MHSTFRMYFVLKKCTEFYFGIFSRCFITSILTQFHQKTVQKKIEVIDLLVASVLAHSVTAVFERVSVKLEN